MPLSVNVSTGLVKGRFGDRVVLGPNGEKLLVPARGRIDFEGMTPFSSFPLASPDPITMLRPKGSGILDSEGYLCTPDAADPSKPGERMVLLQADNDPDSTVQGWTWRATMRFVNADGTRVHNTLDSFTFDLPFGDVPFDLAHAVPVPESVGIGTEQAIILAASAQAHAASADAAAEAALGVAREIAGAVAGKADLIDGKVPEDQLPPAVGVTDEVVAPLMDSPKTAAKIDARVAEQVAGKLDADTAADTFQTKTDAARLPARLGDASTAEGKALAGSHPQWRANGNRVAFLGDSTTMSHYGAGKDAWPDYASILSNQRIRFAVNAGVSGNTSSQMLARIQADVISKSPNVCIISAGINDLGLSTPFATFQSNIRTMVNLLRTAGIAPVITTILPQTNPVVKLPFITKWNLWIKQFAELEGIPVLDWYSLMVDPATGTMKPAMDSGDGIHPSILGYYTMGKYVADNLGPQLPVYSPPLAETQAAADTANLAPSPMFLTGTAGVPTGWTAVGAPTGTKTYTLVSDPAINGQWGQISTTGTNGTCGLGKYWPAAAGIFDPGDKLLVMARVSSDNLSADGGIFFDVIVNGTVVVGVTLRAPIKSGIILREYTIPASINSIQIDFKALGGNGNVRFAQPTIFNLTKLGLA